jgi:glycine hydroxymethyltransferase
VRRENAIIDSPLEQLDPLIAKAIGGEAERQRQAINLLAPSMFLPRAARQALSSVLNDLDAEGYAGDWQDSSNRVDLDDFCKSYDQRGPRKYNPSGPFAEYVELTAARRIARLFSSGTGLKPEQLHVNVQPLSGSAANIAILRALLEPGDSLLSLELASGGHLSHGAGFHYSGATYKVSHYGIPSGGRLDLDQFQARVRESQPEAVIVGGSSYPRAIDWKAIREAINQVSRPPILIADVAHFAGLIAAGCYPNPLPFADVVSMVGYKTFAGPRIGTIITHDPDLARKINRAVFPGTQSAPVMGAIAALAVAARIAQTDDFRLLMRQAIINAQALSEALLNERLQIEFGGTDTHMLLVRLARPTSQVVSSLERVGILTNSNMLPGDAGPMEAHGIRMGTVGITQLGLSESSATELGRLLAGMICSTGDVQGDVADRLREEVRAFVRENLQTPDIFARGYI